MFGSRLNSARYIPDAKVLAKGGNFGSNFEISIGDTAPLIVKAMNSQIEIVTNQASLRSENSDVECLWVDTAEDMQLFGWQPILGGRESLKRDMTEVAKWFI